MRKACSAPWTDVYMSSADNWGSCCCFYLGAQPGAFASDGEVHSLDAVRSSPQLEELRRFQAGGPPVDGCGTCAYSIDMAPERNVYFDFTAVEGLTEAQRSNLDLVRREFEAGTARLTSKPLRASFYFSWGCNLSCGFCYQIPMRDQWKRSLPDDLFERCRDDFRAMMQVECIGGEPFAIPSALAFIRKFVADPELAAVRLVLTTNATLLHKHLSWLKAKERITFSVSIDAVGEAYEALRVGARWDQVEANMLAVVEAMRTERPDWGIVTNAVLTRTGIAGLPEMARFHAEHGIACRFDPLRLNRGNEELIYREDVVAFPGLLDDIPDWERRVEDAIAILERGGVARPGGELGPLLERIRRTAAQPWRIVRPFDGHPAAAIEGAADMSRLMVGAIGPAGSGVSGEEGGLAGFRSSAMEFGLAARINCRGGAPGGGTFGVRLLWPVGMGPTDETCQTVLYEVQPFQLVSWREGEQGGRRTVDMVVHALGTEGADCSLILSLMTRRPDRFAVLPDGLEIWIADS